MTWLVTMGLTNAALALPLAAVAFIVGRWSRRPALAHVLWVVVLLKLLTPPMVEVPVGWKIDLSPYGWQPAEKAEASGRHRAAAAVTSSRQVSPQAAVVTNRATDSGSHSIASSPSEARGTESLVSVVVAADPARHTAAVLLENSTPSLHNAWPARFFFGAIATWMMGSVLTLLLMLTRSWQFRRFINRLSQHDVELDRKVSRLAYVAGLSSRPEAVAVRGPVSPMLWGIGRGMRLIFPTQLARDLNSAACDALLLHELAHYSRGDQWVRLLELVAQVLFWWHPVVWWARHEIEAAEEQCCDAWVVEHQQGTRRAYAEALLATIDFLCLEPLVLPPAASGLGEVPLLKVRLTQIMRGDVAIGLSGPAKVAVLMAGVTLLPLGPSLFGASVRPDRLSSPRMRSAEHESPAASSALSRANEWSLTEAAHPAASDVTAGMQPQLVSTVTSAVAKTRPAPAPWARANSPGGKYQLEARRGLQTTLVTTNPNWRPDLSAHQMRSVAFLPDGRSFISGHEDGLVRLWDSETGGLISSLKGSSAAIWSVAAAPDGRHVAAGAADGSVLVWNLETGEAVAGLPARDVPVSCLRWSQRGDRLAISLADFSDEANATLLIWTVNQGAPALEIALDKPAGALTWLGEDRELLVASWDGEGQLWDLESQTSSVRVTIGREVVKAANWSPDCPLIAASPDDPLITKADAE